MFCDHICGSSTPDMPASTPCVAPFRGPMRHEKSSHHEISFAQMRRTARLAAWNVDLEGAQSRGERRRLETKEFGGPARAIDSTLSASQGFQQVGSFPGAPLALGSNRV